MTDFSINSLNKVVNINSNISIEAQTADEENNELVEELFDSNDNGSSQEFISILKDNNSLENQIQQKQTTISTLETELKELELKEHEYQISLDKNSNKEIEQLQKNVENAVVEKEKAQAQLEKAEKIVNEEKTKYDNAQEKLNQLIEESSKQKTARILTQITIARISLSNTQNSYKKAQNELNLAQNTFTQSTTKLENAEEAYNDALLKQANIQMTGKEYSEQINAKQEALEKAKNELEQLILQKETVQTPTKNSVKEDKTDNNTNIFIGNTTNDIIQAPIENFDTNEVNSAQVVEQIIQEEPQQTVDEEPVITTEAPTIEEATTEQQPQTTVTTETENAISLEEQRKQLIEKLEAEKPILQAQILEANQKYLEKMTNTNADGSFYTEDDIAASQEYSQTLTSINAKINEIDQKIEILRNLSSTVDNEDKNIATTDKVEQPAPSDDNENSNPQANEVQAPAQEVVTPAVDMDSQDEVQAPAQEVIQTTNSNTAQIEEIEAQTNELNLQTAQTIESFKSLSYNKREEAISNELKSASEKLASIYIDAIDSNTMTTNDLFNTINNGLTSFITLIDESTNVHTSGGKEILASTLQAYDTIADKLLETISTDSTISNSNISQLFNDFNNTVLALKNKLNINTSPGEEYAKSLCEKLVDIVNKLSSNSVNDETLSYTEKINLLNSTVSTAIQNVDNTINTFLSDGKEVMVTALNNLNTSINNLSSNILNDNTISNSDKVELLNSSYSGTAKLIKDSISTSSGVGKELLETALNNLVTSSHSLIEIISNDDRINCTDKVELLNNLFTNTGNFTIGAMSVYQVADREKYIEIFNNLNTSINSFINTMLNSEELSDADKVQIFNSSFNSRINFIDDSVSNYMNTQNKIFNPILDSLTAYAVELTDIIDNDEKLSNTNKVNLIDSIFNNTIKSIKDSIPTNFGTGKELLETTLNKLNTTINEINDDIVNDSSLSYPEKFELLIDSYEKTANSIKNSISTYNVPGKTILENTVDNMNNNIGNLVNIFVNDTSLNATDKIQAYSALTKLLEYITDEELTNTIEEKINELLKENPQSAIDFVILSLSDEERALLDTIDIYEKLPDGSPKYIFAAGGDDGQYHIYQMKSSTSGETIIEVELGNNNIYISSSTASDGLPIIKPEIVTTINQESINEVMDELVAIYNDLLQENYHTAKPDLEMLKTAQKEAVTEFSKNEIERSQIAETIVKKLKALGTDGSQILVEIKNNTFRGQKITNLINKLASMIESSQEEDYGMSVLDKGYSTSSPLSFDLNGDGVKTSNEKVFFDIDGDGKLDLINNSADGVLVFDANANGISGENGLEVFGDNTDLNNDGQKDGFNNGFEALRALAQRENLVGLNDNILSAEDITILEEKYGLGIKLGYNGETKTLSELGITEINLGAPNQTETKKNFDNNGNNLMTQQGATFTMNNKTFEYADIWHIKYETTD